MRRPRRSAAAALLAVALAGGACTDDTDDAEPATTTAPADTTASSATTGATDVEIPEFSGDADSAFCRGVADDELPVADPFEPGIPPDEVALRLRALRVRFERLVEVAPAELEAELTELLGRLERLDQTLADFDHDLAAAAEADVDMSFTDDPALARTSARVEAYVDQVCTP